MNASRSVAPPLSRRSYHRRTRASHWEEIWEAGPYYDRLSELLESAREYAIFVGWQIDSRLPLSRPPGGGHEPPGHETLKRKILRISAERPGFRFYFLMWDHAYFYVLERERWQGRVWEDVPRNVHFIFDNRHPFGGSHHEKICIIDGRTALCGGIDLCDDRWDSPSHRYEDPRRSLSLVSEKHGPYHDLGVQVEGPVCAELQRHVAERWRTLSSVPFPDPPGPAGAAAAEGGLPVYFSRTLASIDGAGEGAPIVREIEFLFRDLIGAARRRIILEGQYYWSREVNDLLVAKLHAMKGRDFEVFLILADLARTRSLTRWMATYELSLLERLQAAARDTGTRLTMGTPDVHPPAGSPGEPKPVYIHSKLMIVDDRYLCVGSANFAARALRIDTEVGLTLEGATPALRARIQAVGDRVLRHWRVESPSIRTAPARDELECLGSDIRLRPFRPRLELDHRGAGAWLARPWRTTIPFQLFFDPELPWPYRFKRRFRRLARRRASAIALAMLGFWLLGAGLALALAGIPGPWPAAYSVLLSSAWVLPVAFFPTALVASLHLGAEPAARLIVSALWVASTFGYCLARMYPTATARYYNRVGPSWLPERIGKRSFGALVSVVADPWLELRFKIAYQGLYCVPLPWFALTTWLALPAALYVACRMAASLAPARLIESVRERPAAWLCGLTILTASRVAVRLAARTWQRKKTGETTGHASEDRKKAA